MVEFNLKVNEKQGTIYLHKRIRDAWGYNLKIRFGLVCGVIYPSGVPIEDLVKNLNIIILKLEHENEMKKKGKLSFREKK